MDKAIEQIFKVFNHLAREIQVYLFSGLLIATNVLIIDNFYYNNALLSFIRTNSLTIPVAIILYLLGQFSMAFYYTIIELPKFDKKINLLLGFSYTVDSNALPAIYKKDPELYIHFVERYIILTMMRWTLSAGCAINFLVDIAFLIKKDFHWQFLSTTIIFGIGAIFLYILSIRTEKDYADRIDSLK